MTPAERAPPLAMDWQDDIKSEAPRAFLEIPTTVFVDRVDVDMPSLPPIALYVPRSGPAAPAPDAGIDEFVVLRAADQAFSALALTQHATVWVRSEELRRVPGLADRVAAKSAQNPTLPLDKRMHALRQSAIMVVDDLFEDPSPENVTRSTKVVSTFVHLLMKEPKSYLVLSRLSSHDPYTLQHSVGTAVNCIILAKKLGISGEKELLDVGMAGLLHDIGKVKVKREIINKEGPLDDEEWTEMKTHSAEGYALVKDNPTLSERTKRAILEHHEDRNGTGYPNGAKYDEVDLFSKIVCISDVFNALTTNRSYSKARTPFDALKLMREKLQHKIDEDLFKQMVLVYGGQVE